MNVLHFGIADLVLLLGFIVFTAGVVAMNFVPFFI